MMPGQPQQEDQYIITELESSLIVEEVVEPTATELPGDLDMLAVIHPIGLAESFDVRHRPNGPFREAHAASRRSIIAFLSKPATEPDGHDGTPQPARRAIFSASFRLGELNTPRATQ